MGYSGASGSAGPITLSRDRQIELVVVGRQARNQGTNDNKTAGITTIPLISCSRSSFINHQHVVDWRDSREEKCITLTLLPMCATPAFDPPISASFSVSNLQLATTQQNSQLTYIPRGRENIGIAAMAFYHMSSECMA